MGLLRVTRRTLLRWFNARGGTRTRTGLLPRDFKSLASTDSATRAGSMKITTRPRRRRGRPASSEFPLPHRRSELTFLRWTRGFRLVWK